MPAETSGRTKVPSQSAASGPHISQHRWVAFLSQREEQVFLALTLVIGALVGLTVVAFIVLTEHFGARISPMNASRWQRLVVPVLGSLTMGYLLYRYFPNARGSGVPQTKAALYARGGVISVRTVVGKFFCTSATLASGIPLGREGPAVQVGGGIASVLGRKLGLRTERVKALIPVGAAAAVAAAFNTPMAAVLFALEEVVGDLHAPVLGSVVLACATSWAVLRVLLGNDPLFKVPQYQLVHPAEFGVYAILGVLGGLVSVVFVKSLLGLREKFMRLPPSTVWFQPVAGGLTVGMMGWFVPQVLGVGYTHVGEALNGTIALRMMLILLLLKLIGVVVSYASGNAGGIFGPSLFLGAMLGGAVGNIAHNVAPGYVAQPGVYALVGMGTAFAGIVRAPMTSVLMIFEITRDYSVIVPLMISNLVSFFISQRLQPQPIYEKLAHQDGIHLPTSGTRALQGQPQVVQAMRAPAEILEAQMSLEEAAALVRSSELRAWPVQDKSGIIGMLSVEDLRTALANRGEGRTVTDLISANPVEFPHLHADHSLTVALERLGASRLDALPVVSRANVHKLEGIVALRDVLNFYGFAQPHATNQETV